MMKGPRVPSALLAALNCGRSRGNLVVDPKGSEGDTIEQWIVKLRLDAHCGEAINKRGRQSLISGYTEQNQLYI